MMQCLYVLGATSIEQWSQTTVKKSGIKLIGISLEEFNASIIPQFNFLGAYWINSPWKTARWKSPTWGR